MDGICPNCGATLADDAVACPECGSCEETGWSDRARYDSIGVDYDSSDFNYDEFIDREFGSNQSSWDRRRVVMAVIAIGLVFVFLFAFF